MIQGRRKLTGHQDRMHVHCTVYSSQNKIVDELHSNQQGFMANVEPLGFRTDCKSAMIQETVSQLWFRPDCKPTGIYAMPAGNQDRL